MELTDENIVNIILIILTLIEQCLGYMPDGYPRSTLQIFIFFLVFLGKKMKEKKFVKENPEENNQEPPPVPPNTSYEHQYDEEIIVI